MANFAETNKFFVLFRAALDSGEAGEAVFLNLADIDEISVDVILVLLAMVNNKQSKVVAGNSPLKTEPGRLLHRSGFYEHVMSSAPNRRKNGYLGTIAKHSNDIVDNQLASRLVLDASKALYGFEKSIPTVYRILVEAMGNTREWANRQGKEKWWVLLYCDETERIAKFVFYDNGVGIIRSLRHKLLDFFAKFAFSDVQLIEEIMKEGQGHSRTGLPSRGRGLPAIAKTLTRGDVRSLKLITNFVFADVANHSYTPLETEFRGTLFYWELKKNEN